MKPLAFPTLPGSTVLNFVLDIGTKIDGVRLGLPNGLLLGFFIFLGALKAKQVFLNRAPICYNFN